MKLKQKKAGDERERIKQIMISNAITAEVYSLKYLQIIAHSLKFLTRELEEDNLLKFTQKLKKLRE